MKDKYMADKPCEKCVPSRLMPRKSTAEDWGIFHKNNCRICAPFKEWQNRPLWELKQKMKEIPTASLIAELGKRRPCGKCVCLCRANDKGCQCDRCRQSNPPYDS